MNTLEIRVFQPREGDRPGWPEARLFIDGVDLIEIVKPIEAPFAEAEGKPQLAGSYMGLRPEDAFLPSRLLLGEPTGETDWFGDGSAVLTSCVCGEYGCWPLTAFIDVDERTVTWRGFRHGHRDWSYEGLGPFVFDRRQYEAALRNDT